MAPRCVDAARVLDANAGRCVAVNRTVRLASAILGFLIPLLAVIPASADLVGHGGPVRGIAVSDDGHLALTASFDYSLILWDLDQALQKSQP